MDPPRLRLVTIGPRLDRRSSAMLYSARRAPRIIHASPCERSPHSVVDARVFRSYDIRALVPGLVDPESAYYGKLDDPGAFNAPLDAAGVEAIGRGLAEIRSEARRVGIRAQDMRR